MTSHISITLTFLEAPLLRFNSISVTSHGDNPIKKIENVDSYLFFSDNVDIVDRVHALRQVSSVLHSWIGIGHGRHSCSSVTRCLKERVLRTRSLVGWSVTRWRCGTDMTCRTNGDAAFVKIKRNNRRGWWCRCCWCSRTEEWTESGEFQGVWCDEAGFVSLRKGTNCCHTKKWNCSFCFLTKLTNCAGILLFSSGGRYEL